MLLPIAIGTIGIPDVDVVLIVVESSLMWVVAKPKKDPAMRWGLFNFEI